VIVDDIDRLTGPEIRDMLGLARLTALPEDHLFPGL
jgi:hypothetical protein